MLEPCPFCGAAAIFNKMGSFCAIKCAVCEVSTKLLESEAAAIEVWNTRKSNSAPISANPKTDAELVAGLEQMRKMVTGEVQTIGELVRANPNMFRAQPMDSTLTLARRRLEQLVTDQRRVNGEPYGNLYEPSQKPPHEPTAYEQQQQEQYRSVSEAFTGRERHP